MRLWTRIGCWPVLVLVVLLLTSCSKQGGGSGARVGWETELAEIHEIYVAFVKSEKKPPGSLADLRRLQAASPLGLRALESGECIAIWNVNIKGPESNNTILAYEKSVPRDGGLVVMANGSIRKMNAQEFQAATKH